MWRAIIDDVSPDFTIYNIMNQPWNTYLHENNVFEFNILGYSQKGLPSLKIKFQDEVYGEIEEMESGSGSEGSGGAGKQKAKTAFTLIKLSYVKSTNYR